MSEIEPPTDLPPDDRTTPLPIDSDESAYPGDPATHRSDGPVDPAGVQQQTEDVDDQEEG
ncbi:MAG: hypothetical protein ABWZ26_02430 [Candidatus Nanopelagicales bacterium]